MDEMGYIRYAFRKATKKLADKKLQKVMTRLRGGRPRKIVSDDVIRNRANRLLGRGAENSSFSVSFCGKF
jgi:hypothetical protein